MLMTEYIRQLNDLVEEHGDHDVILLGSGDEREMPLPEFNSDTDPAFVWDC